MNLWISCLTLCIRDAQYTGTGKIPLYFKQYNIVILLSSVFIRCCSKLHCYAASVLPKLTQNRKMNTMDQTDKTHSTRLKLINKEQ